MTMTTLKEDLTALRTLLSDPRHWIQGVYARNEQGVSVISNDRTACAWCLSGALTRVVVDATRGNSFSGLAFDEKWLEIESALLMQTNEPNLVAFNDARSTTHEDVLRVIDDAIKRAP